MYNRESKAKGKEFIKVVTGKHKTVNSTKRGMKFDLESELKDIDVMLDEMNAGDKSLIKDSTDKVVDLNKQDDMEVEVKAIGICTFANSNETYAGKEIAIKGENMLWKGKSEQIDEEYIEENGLDVIKPEIQVDEEVRDNRTEVPQHNEQNTGFTENIQKASVADKDNQEITDNIGQQVQQVTDNVGQQVTDGQQVQQVTDNVGQQVTDSQQVQQVTDNVGQQVTDSQQVQQVRDSISQQVTDGQQVTDNTNQQVTDNTNREVTDNVVATDNVITEQITTDNEKEHSDDTKSDEETDENPVSIDESFSKVCSTCLTNPESSSNNKKDTEKESDSENKCVVAKNITENGNRKKTD